MIKNKYIKRPIRSCRKKIYIEFYTENKKTKISLHNFNIKNPSTIIGKLQFSSQIIINNGIFNILFHFPLKKSIEFEIRCKNITKKKFVYFIKKIYQYIYDIEEITSTPIEYFYLDNCHECLSIDNYLIPNINFNEIEKCVICLNFFNNDNKGVILLCNHKFHYNCIIDWTVYGNGKTCPICRKHIFKCSFCNGTKVIKKRYYNKIIPIKHREDENIRNETNGIFEIYNYDFDKLLLDSIYIDKRNSKIDIYVTV